MMRLQNSSTPAADQPLRLEYWEADRLDDNPSNWRKHPKRQLDAIESVMGEVGWAGALLFNERTNRLVDGHARKAVHKGRGLVPVLVGSWTEEQERKILATLDPIGEMAGIDYDKLSSLAVGVGEMAAVAMGYLPPMEEPALAGPTPSKSIVKFSETAIFPSSNDYGIPDLRDDMLCSRHPVRVFAGMAADMAGVSSPDDYLFLPSTVSFSHKPAGGFLGFYVEDYQFEKCWHEAVTYVSDLHDKGWSGVLTPDFSTWEDDPLAVMLWNAYRNRWVARYWQEAGLPVIPSVMGLPRAICGDGEGIPAGCPVVSMQCRTHSKRDTWSLRDHVRVIESVRPGTVMVYGGENREQIERYFPDGPHYVWLKSWTAERFEKRKAKRKGDGDGR